MKRVNEMLRMIKRLVRPRPDTCKVRSVDQGAVVVVVKWSTQSILD